MTTDKKVRNHHMNIFGRGHFLVRALFFELSQKWPEFPYRKSGQAYFTRYIYVYVCMYVCMYMYITDYLK